MCTPAWRSPDDLIAGEEAVQLRPIALTRDILKGLAEHRFGDVVQPCRLVFEALGQADPLSPAAALRWTSRAARAHELLPDLVELAKRYDDVPEFQRTRYVVGQFCCGRGVIAACAGDHDAAAEAFAIGLAAARSANDRWLTAELLAGFGESLVAAGRGDEAGPLLEEARGLWEEMGATAWLERIASVRPRAEINA